MADAERCGGCGLSPDDGWWVAAVVTRCPTCEDLDRKRDEIRKDRGTGDTAGLRVRFDHLTTVDESVLESSNAWFTLEGARARVAELTRRRRRSA